MAAFRHCGVTGRGGFREMEPLEVAAEVFGSDATIATQESLEALMAAVHRLDGSHPGPSHRPID